MRISTFLRLSPLYRLVILILMPMLWSPSGLSVNARELQQTPSEQAERFLERLTPEERVGQLFLITFQGNQVNPDTQIYNLINKYHIGGVVLRAENDNIVEDDEAAGDSIHSLYELIQQLQQTEWDASHENQINPTTEEAFLPEFIPMFIGISQEGGSYPNNQIMRGLTLLPNAMTLGATWEPELAAQVGNVAGMELSTLGVNLLLGPSLDVLEGPQLESKNTLGTRTFGGDPFWVAEMGKAYIRGIHQGSNGMVAVVAKHFPGHGSSDRLPEEEVATVRKSLDELKSFDLAPFFAVTGYATSPEETTDALLASHIRYQGLQGNIRATTRPVSLDPQAISLLMDLSPFDIWRQNGGLIVSDNLGSLAVRRFYDLTSQTFDARRVALNAFLAGNDLLYIADFTSTGDPDPELATALTLDFFAQKYHDDTAFAQRVDESVLRILTLKFRLYNNFNLETVLAGQGNLDDLGKSSQVTFEVARQAATLISPSQQDVDITIPDSPNQNDRIVIITDVRNVQQCSECTPFPILDVKAFQDAITRLYGPQAGGQIRPNNLSSYSLADLEEIIENSQIDSLLELDLQRANWIIVGLLDESENVPSFQTLSRFLSERPDLIQQKRLIVFALCAPYYMDATNISKLTAYYGLYTSSPQFVDVAAYILFHELRPSGALPVSVPGIDYDLNIALFPDPGQLIPLVLDIAPPEINVSTVTPTPMPAPEFHLGDVIPLYAGVIMDHNGNPVPDGTPVNFVFSMGGEATSLTQVQTTISGIARTTYSVTTPGTLEIRAESENARSEVMRFDIPLPSGEFVGETETPTIQPTTSSEPPPTFTPFKEPTATITPTPTSNQAPELFDWFLAVFISGIVAWASFKIGAWLGQVRWGMRAGFLTLICGLLTYSYLTLRLPGSLALLEGAITLNIILTTLAGTLIGILATLTWKLISDQGIKNSMNANNRNGEE